MIFCAGKECLRTTPPEKAGYAPPFFITDAITIPAPATRITAPTTGETGIRFFVSATASTGPISRTFSRFVNVK